MKAVHKKIQAIEEFDGNIVVEILKMKNEFKDLRILVLARPRDTGLA